MEHVKDYEADVIFLTETWMQFDNDDVTATVKTHGYKLLHNRRRNREKSTTGGGVGFMVKSSLIVRHVTAKHFSSFEQTMVKIKLKNNSTLTLISLYPLLFVPANIFIDELTVFFEILSVSSDVFVLSGDVNIHMDTDDTYAIRLKEVFSMFNLTQFVDIPTHKHGHSIDIVLATSDSPIIDDVLPNDVKHSDHFLIEFKVSTIPIKKAYKSVTYRDIKSINNEQFCTDVKEVCMNNQSNNMQESMTNYNSLLSEIVDCHAPIKTKQVKIVPNAPWFDLQYKSLQQRRR